MQNVIYLEGSDFNPDGSVVSDGRPTIIMCYADYCGHCKSAKPAFQSIVSKAPNIRVCAVHGGDGGATDRQAEEVVRNLLKPFRGYPSYLLMDKNGRFVSAYEGDRSAEAIIEFCSKNS